jgi:hypothetical protein
MPHKPTVRGFHAYSIPATPKNGNGRQQPSMSNEESIALTEVPLVFQLPIKPPRKNCLAFRQL